MYAHESTGRAMEETLKFTICHVPEMILAKDLCGTSVDVQHHGRGVLLEGWGVCDFHHNNFPCGRHITNNVLHHEMQGFD